MDHGTTAGSRSMVDSRPWAARPLQGMGSHRDSLERGRGGLGSHQWCHMEAELWRWPHDGAQQRRLVVLQWGVGFGCEEERLELGLVRWIIGVLSSCFL
jgi:hypothetical protein